MTSQVQPQVPVPVQEKRLAAEAHGKKKKNKKVSLDPTICDDEAILRDLCLLNGVNFEKLHHGIGAKIEKLEIFFFGCPRIPIGLDHFPNLLTLCIVNQRFNCISGLEACPLLKELWICETQVKKIEALDHCHNLLRLHLYSNLIAKIEGLEKLSRLEKLWLNGNAISSIEGLEELTLLKDLNLAGNKIETIGKSLNHLSYLEDLDLSGNKISSLVELVHLAGLPKLTSLSFCHPMHSPNPVCCLCNYSTHTLYHFPQLRWLDGREVGSQDLQKLVQGLVLRKIQYYRMQTHYCRTVGRHKIKQLQDRLMAHLEECHIKLRALSKHFKILSNNQVSADELEIVNGLLSIITCHIDRSKKICSGACKDIEADTNQKCQFWMMELNSGGNVKLISCNQSQPCFSSCSELVQSRFSATVVESLGITGLEVTEVVRIENRLLFNGFNDKLKSLLDKEPYLSMTTSQLDRKMVDYLFLVWREGCTSVCDICQDGFSHPPADPPSSPVIWLTNSVNIADHLRLAQQARGKIEQGKLLLCKVFIGQAIETTSSALPMRADFPGADSVFRVHGPATHNSSADLFSKDWFLFDQSLVLPEYIIHFNYLSPHFPDNPLEAYISSHLLPGDEEISSLTPTTSIIPRLAMLDEPTLLELTGHPSLMCVQEVNICDNRLTRFRLASGLPQLTHLILSGNELSIAEDFGNLPNLEILDLSFNKLACLQGLKSLPKLKCLDISWNYMINYHEDLGPLRKHCPALEDLDTRHNPWNKHEFLRSYILGRIRTLHKIDGHTVTQDETSMAIKNVVSSHLTLATLLSYSHTTIAPLPSLSVFPIAQTIGHQLHSLNATTTSSTDWCAKVTAVCLNDLGLRKLAHLDQFPNLRWLSLANNALVSLEGLFQCTSLDELTLDNNLLCNISGIGNLHSLRWLSLSCNQLTELPSDLWSLAKLHYLNLSHNALSNLQDLQHLTSLMELYLSANMVSSLRELFTFKSLCSLIVLDLTFNPVVTMDTYRPFVVFHLPFLKALDGRPIEVGEIAGAKEKLGGQLTQDFVFQKCPSLPFKDMLKLDLPNCGLKHVDLSPVDSFFNLSSLNLENNSLTSFSGIVLLDQLKVLCLNHNRIEQIIPETSSSVLRNLQVLHLAYNGISNLASLHLNTIPSLKALFLQGNEISKVEGLDQLSDLTELVLDRNKIKSIQEYSFFGLDRLRELHLEENRLRDLSHFKPLPCLERLYLGLNRIPDYHQLEKLNHLQNLTELSIISNPVSRRLQHRVLLIYQHPALASLDGVSVTAVERQAAEMVFGTDQQESELSTDVAMLPGLSGATPLRVMNVPFGCSQRHQPPDCRPAQRQMQNVQGLDKRKRGKTYSNLTDS